MKKIMVQPLSKILFTPKGYQDLLTRQKKLELERPAAVDDLQKAREMGDLSENGYYKAARAKLSFIDAQLRRSERLLKQAFVVQPKTKDEVEIGSQVKISDGQKTYQYDLVGGYESNPLKGTISHRSPLGRALMGKKEKEVVEVHAPNGVKKYTILKIN
jgi:transcription elongation factor GreA